MNNKNLQISEFIFWSDEILRLEKEESKLLTQLTKLEKKMNEISIAKMDAYKRTRRELIEILKISKS